MALPNVAGFISSVNGSTDLPDPVVQKVRRPNASGVNPIPTFARPFRVAGIEANGPVRPVNFQRPYAPAPTPAPAAAPAPTPTPSDDSVGLGEGFATPGSANTPTPPTPSPRGSYPAAPAIPVFNPTGPSALSANTPDYSAPPSVIPSQNSASDAGATRLPTMTVTGNGDASQAPSAADGSAPGSYNGFTKENTGVKGIFKITDPRNPNAAPVYTNVPGMTATEMGANGGQLRPGITVADAGAIGNPGTGVAISEASGGKVTPEVGQFARPTAPAVATDNGAADVDAAQRGANSDIQSILNEDPRSAAGIAARNARINLAGLHGARTSRYNGGQTPLEAAVGSLIEQARAPVTAAQQRALENSRAQGELARANIAANAGVQEAALHRPEAPRQVLADGTIGQIGPDGISRPVLGTDGQPVKVAQTKETPDDKQGDEVSKTAAKLYSDAQFSGTPLSIEQARQQALAIHGKASPAAGGARPTATGKDGTKYTLSADGKSWVKQNG